MPRASSSITVVLGVVAAALGAGFGTAWAAPSPTPAGAAGAAAVVEGKKVCAITDSKLVELSGLVATKAGYVTVNDSTDVSSREKVFFLDKKCKVTDSVSYPGGGPRDTEDLALSPDGKTLWVADTGNNITSDDLRESIVLWSLPADGSKQPTLHRFVYPDDKPRDAEALVMTGTGAGTPLVITKSAGPAELFVPASAIKSGNSTGVPMKKVGDVTVPKTETPNLLNAAGRLTVTGAARSADGTKVVLRTYADAFEWDVADGGDVVAALTGGTAPRITGLTDPFGEAISYTTDGKQFVTVSDGGNLGDDPEINILSYVPATPTPPTAGAKTDGAAGGGGGSFLDNLSLKDITTLIAAIGVIGLILVGAGVAGIIVARKKKAAGGGAEPPAGGARVGRQVAPDQATWDKDGNSGNVYGGQPGGGGVYGGQPAPAGGVYGGQQAAPGGGVYGGQPQRGGGGGVYGGGGQRGGGVYGGGPGGQGDGYGPPQQGGQPGYGPPQQGGQRGAGYGRQRSAPDDYDYGPQDQRGRDGYDGNGYVGSGYRG
ncbi:hypothetical protein SAMN05421812_104560 [Asanoa hainanensis]|uniref:Uncharacterized protein n=1 Tax=Asanoa hainanensis TaxID=560556 RepID=A0A239LUE1_9ACTN|nr:hypothetical protein [Asanoa hainanensis]SNT33423.1 hypothetical protein SAMN05421812_104560 [Asanoa hainanensis]